MTSARSNNGSPWQALRIRVPDFAVSWAGPGERDDEFCLGSEDGRLQITTVEGELLGEFHSGIENAEAVNGVAFIGPVIAVSTRNEVTFWTRPGPGIMKAQQRAVFPCGAHGVIATTEGYFIAPLGRSGLLKVRMGPQKDQPLTVIRDKNLTFDFYKAVSLHSYGHPEVIACAARFAGVAALPLPPDGEQGWISSITFSGLDVVDVCSLGTGATPPAAAAVSKNGILVLLRDVLHERDPVTLRFEQIPGVVYRVLSAKGSLFLLTSAGLYVLVGLARCFLEGESVDTVPTRVRGKQLEAVDANLCGERWLLVVMTDSVLRFDIDRLIGEAAGVEQTDETPDLNPTSIKPDWRSSDTVRELLSVGV